MPSIFAFALAAVLLGAAGIVLWIVWRTLREQALLKRTLDIQMFEVLLPKDLKPDEKEEEVGEELKARIAVAEQWLSTLVNLPTTWWERWLYGRPMIVFEIVVRPDGLIVFYAGCERRFLDHLEKQIYAHYPQAEVRLAPDYTIFEPGDAIRMGSLSLARSSHLPLATYRELEVDPLQALTGALAKIQRKDAAVIQYVLQPAKIRAQRRARKAAREIIRGKRSDLEEGMFEKFGRARRKLTGTVEESERLSAELRQLTPRMQQRVELVEQKATQPQFAVNIRVAVSCAQPEESERVFQGIVGAFSQYDFPDLNRLRLKTANRKSRFLRDFVFRVPRIRAANILGTTEMASLFHFPLPQTGTPSILWRGAKVAAAPTSLSQTGIFLGVNRYRGIETPVYLADDDRRRHLYLIGQTGTGKTTLFLNMIVQDIMAGHGVGVVDPHGDLIEDILLHIPPERHQDVILFDPRDTERPLGFNILEVKDAAQRDLVVNEVVQILTKLAARLNPESIGPMFEHYLRNALLALAQDPEATLVDVPRMFVDAPFRTKILRHVTNPTVRQFWEQEFAQSQRGQLSADMLSYVISKLGRFIGNEVVRNLIGQARSAFDVREVMDQRKILLCNLSKGSLGDINSDLLGFVLVSKIQIAALGRANIPERERSDFYLYLDEFQNFTTDSIATILSEARKYHLNLNLTHQFIEQLEEHIREAVFGNVGTMISYRIGVNDAEFLAKQFAPTFSEYDLLRLPRFTAVIRMLASGTPQRSFSLNIMPPPTGGDPDQREAVRQFSRARYGRSRSDVEAEILARFQAGPEEDKPTAAGAGDYMSETLFDLSGGPR